MSANDMKLLHVYGQFTPHDEVVIAGDLKGLTALRDSINSIIENKNVLDKDIKKIDVTTSDGEGYELLIALNQNDWQGDFWQNKSIPYYSSITAGLQLGTAKDNVIRECRQKYSLVGAYLHKAHSGIRVGDRVQFKSWDEMVEEYGIRHGGHTIPCLYSFTDEMKHLCCTYARVTSIKKDPIGRTGLILGNFSVEYGDTNFTYSTDMVKKVIPTEWDVR